jgi:hypothetical protein
VLDGSGRARPPQATTQPEKVLKFYHEIEIMKIGIICSTLIEKKPPLQQSWAF